MKLRELSSTEDIRYSWTDGGFHREFTHKEKNYDRYSIFDRVCRRICRILKVQEGDSADNITAPIDEREVFMKRYRTFKVENLNDSIREFILDYAI